MNQQNQANFIPNDDFCTEQIRLNQNGKTAPEKEEGASGKEKEKAADTHVQSGSQNTKGKRKTPSQKSDQQEKKNKNKGKKSKVNCQRQKDNENVDFQLSGESNDSSNELRSLSGQTLGEEKCGKYELLRENYKNLRQNYLQLRRRYEERGLLLKATSPIQERQQKERTQVREIMELQGTDLIPEIDILEMEEDKKDSQWNLRFLETDGFIWKVRWTKE